MPSDVLPPNLADLLPSVFAHGPTSTPSAIFLPANVLPPMPYLPRYVLTLSSADQLPAILVLGSTPTYFRCSNHFKPFLTSDTLPPILAVGPTRTHFCLRVHSHLFSPTPLRTIFARRPTPTYFSHLTFSHPFSPTGPLQPIFTCSTQAYFRPLTAADPLPPIFAVGPTRTPFRPRVHSHLFSPASFRPIFRAPTPPYFRRRTHSHPFSTPALSNHGR